MGDSGDRFTITSWSDAGIASFEAAGTDRRSALEAGVQAALALAIGHETDVSGREALRSVPLRGEGEDLVTLFADLLEDLFVQMDDFGAALHAVVIDGVLRRDRGGFVAWGYAAIDDAAAPAVKPPRLQGLPQVSESQSAGVVIRAALGRDL